MTWEPSEGFLITMFGGVSALFVSMCACVLRSRCTKLKFGCIECERSVLDAKDFGTVADIKDATSPQYASTQ